MRVFLTFIILVIGIFTAYYINKSAQDRKQLPVIQPRDVNSEMVNPELINMGIGHRIGEFALTNQNGETITLEDVKGKIFVAEYFFTTCLTICPVMTEEMTRVQKRFNGNKDVKILSFTVDPEIDDVKVMRAYADKHNAVDGQWHFLTGTKADLYSLARNSFFVLKPAEAMNLGDAGSDFIHTNNFVLVDEQLRIRGYYDGTSTEEIDIMMEDIDLLLNEK
ncbi:SCO family protein [Brumimicrobium glaciale]|jgi:protein SCO1/2|uniref:SCO family protein n=1 Tax=Brumimicrobium glaciale TaxID=200475 RepID=A0A4V1WG58_9FLAO|nr:SCO family protein [Brumimicrobium glaciale]RYM35551.1 SCO family protein [Brumimicrobium glaciale]